MKKQKNNLTLEEKIELFEKEKKEFYSKIVARIDEDSQEFYRKYLNILKGKSS